MNATASKKVMPTEQEVDTDVLPVEIGMSMRESGYSHLIDPLTPSERHARTSQLPSVHDVRAAPHKIDPEGCSRPIDELTPSERHARLSQLPSAHDIKVDPRKIDPEDLLTPSERSARVSQLPEAKDIKKSLQNTRSRDFRRFLALFVLVVLVVVTVVVILSKPERAASRSQEVISFLAEKGISRIEDLESIGSPQNSAATWIADVDKLVIPISTDHKFLDRYVLAVLYFALGGGDTWPDSLNFLSQDHVCDWWGFTDLDSMTIDQQNHPIAGVHGCLEVDSDLVPTGIALPAHALYGHIPDEIRHLDHLWALQMQYNPALSGQLPSAISSLTELRILSLQHCSLTGPLPEWIGNMQQLTSLELGNNLLTGKVPASIGKLTGLVQLGLDENHLEADVATFGPLTNLRFLFLEGNQIEGTLSNSLLLENWKQLSVLDLSQNQLSSTIPEDIFAHPNLRVLDLHSNFLTGTIPFVRVEVNSRLEVLALQQNRLEFGIPTSIALLRSLKHLDVSGNALGSTLPSSIGSLFGLKSLYVGDNNFSPSPFPSFLEDAVNPLEELSLTGMRLTGSVPRSLERLSLLRYLDLSKNELQGAIPRELGSLSHLKYLLLQNNRFTGSLPNQFSALSNLDVLLLEENNLTGTLDPVCQRPANVSFLVSDCGGRKPPVSCPCCSICCGDGEEDCNDLKWSANLDPSHEYNYGREQYDFGHGIVFFP